jgi:hypothetical protein
MNNTTNLQPNIINQINEINAFQSVYKKYEKEQEHKELSNGFDSILEIVSNNKKIKEKEETINYLHTIIN